MDERRSRQERDAAVLARLETLVRAVEAEARANGTLELFERWREELKAPQPVKRTRKRS